MPNTESDFRTYCRQLTDSQVLAVVQKENEGRIRDRDREADYRDAVAEAVDRGIMAAVLDL